VCVCVCVCVCVLTLQSPAALRRTLESSSPFSSCDTSDAESCSLPVNSASLLRRHAAAGQKTPPVRGHVLRKAKVGIIKKKKKKKKYS